AGIVSGTVDFGGGPVGGGGGDDVFVVMYDTDGNYQWALRGGDALAQTATGIAVDGGGNVIVTGYFEGTLSLPPVTLVSAGLSDAFVIKISPAGVPLWGNKYGDAGEQLGLAV